MIHLGIHSKLIYGAFVCQALSCVLGDAAVNADTNSCLHRTYILVCVWGKGCR